MSIAETETAPATATELKFHLSLNVNDLERSIEFLRLLFGVEPSKCRSDYAKFEPTELPLVLSLEPRRTASADVRGTSGQGSLNHLGIRMPSAAALVAVQRRLEEAGIRTQREEGVECCYARQTKFWVHDPDQNLWEVYVLEEDIQHRGAGQARHDIIPEPSIVQHAPATSWAHRLGADFAESLDNDSLDEAMLQGTFNADRFRNAWPMILERVHAALKPGGKLFIHVLTSNQPLSSAPSLPGPAAVVTHIPTVAEVVAAVEAAAFQSIHLTKFGESPCFVHDGVEMRETQLVAWKAHAPTSAANKRLMYKGPFAQLQDDAGQTYKRGEWINVDQATWTQLKQSPSASQFVFV